MPKFNSFVYDGNERQVGKVEEVFGPIFAPLVAFKPVGDYIVGSIAKEQQFGLRQGQMLPVSRFRPQPERPKLAPKSAQGKKPGFKGKPQFNKGGPQRDFRKPGQSFQGSRFGGNRDRPAGQDKRFDSQGRFTGSQGGRFSR